MKTVCRLRPLRECCNFVLLLLLTISCLGCAFTSLPTTGSSTFRSWELASSKAPTALSMARNRGRSSSLSSPPLKAAEVNEERWFPIQKKKKVVYDDDIYGAADPADDDEGEQEEDDDIEAKGVQLMARLISQRLGDMKAQAEENPAEEPIHSYTKPPSIPTSGNTLRNSKLAKGRFIDLTCTEEGEQILEGLFLMGDAAREKDPRVIQAAVMALQSILVFGTQVGVKGSPVQLQRMIAHLDSRGDQEKFKLRDLETWDTDSVRRLKYRLNKYPGTQVLATLQWRRTTQGAYDLLVALGAWGKHEDLPLIRSGFSIRFNQAEEEAAEIASRTIRDPDEALGLRTDLRHLKVFTIDSADTSEIDDGISLEKFTDDSGAERQRIWIHIADAERWAPKNSKLCDIARRRVTSLYLPRGPIPMLPPKASDDLMSLIMNRDSYALSLGVELNEDGSIDDSSITVTPSLIRVSYRLTYDEVDEMLAEGIGFYEEWELGGLLGFATTRRNYRISQGSAEGLVPNPIPQRTISIAQDADATDGISIDVSVHASHNAGSNQTAGAESSDDNNNAYTANVEPVSEAFTLVTETMILAGEAIGRWKLLQDKICREQEETSGFYNEVRMPFRTQRKPDYTSRARERQVMNDLLEYNVGGGYCYSWYCRRFLSPVKVTETCAPHSGLGLAAYVQWTSPIRRYSDLLVHNSVKLYLRRQRIHKLLSEGKSVEDLDLIPEDIGGCPLPSSSGNGKWDTLFVDDIDFREGGGLVGPSRMLQRQSEQYWLFEHIRRTTEADPEKVWDALVLGYIGSGGQAKNNKKQFAIYIYELGFEYKITSPINLRNGVALKLRVSVISPRAGQLAFVQVNA